MTEIGRSQADRLLIATLVTGATQREAAEAAGCSERTVRRRLDNPDFRKALDQARGRLFERVLGRTIHHATMAADILAEIMTDPESRAAVRVSAARALLDSAMRYREVEELARRIEAIEEALEARSAT